MALDQQVIDQIAAWCLISTEIAGERKKAWSLFFGEDDPKPVRYLAELGDRSSRERRFVGWFMVDYVLPSGERPGEIAAKRLFSGGERTEALGAVRRARFLLGLISKIASRGVSLQLGGEVFEVVSPHWAATVRPQQAVFAHILPRGQGQWLPGPGWIVWPVSFGPGLRSQLEHMQMDPISLERMLQGRGEPEEAAPRKPSPQDYTLEKAVARLTRWAHKTHRPGLVMSPDEWQSLVLKYMGIGRRPASVSDYIGELVKKGGNFAAKEELQELADLATNIWNNTPQPDRGGKSASQLRRG